MKTKICSNPKCRKELPATTEFFYKQEGGKFGLRAACKKCCKDYEQSEKGRTTRTKYRQSIKGRKKLRLVQKRHIQTDKYRTTRRNWEQLEKTRSMRKKYRQSKKGKAVVKKYRQTEKSKEQLKKRYNENKLSKCISSMIYLSLKQNKAGEHWEIFVPYTLEKLTLHLQKTIGLTDKVYLSEFWQYFYGQLYHVDHIIPRAFFDKEKLQDLNSEEFGVCWALENLQLLPPEKNRRKSDKLD